ncbi:acyltransferase [Paenibacillus lupini]|uniref:acyltransferase family protein n=1 Tax=Paenibacillus lupini TaxID=1450204 RepID=UPI00141DD914|nr:peptidoglycan/LPS O-acetylase OafA/YrhL [Paenibacillus lupini]
MRRFEELDSLRGLAALTVVFCHFLLIFPAMDYLYSNPDGEGSIWVKALTYSPLHLLWGGHEAVILFFLLSGFVLTLPFLKSKQAYIPYLIRRICRIYLPYLIAVVIALIACVSLYSGVVSGLSEWFNIRWVDPISIKAILAHLSLILLPGSMMNEYNAVLWTLVHEMRISIIFPLVVFAVNRLSWRNSLILAVLISLAGFSGKYIAYPFHGNELVTTLQYLGIFVVGSLLAKHKNTLQQFFMKLTAAKSAILLVFAVLSYTYSWWFFYDIKIIHLEIINDWIITVGASIFILFALYSKAFSRVLLVKPIHYLGRISYSLYLYHFIVLISLVHLFNGQLPIWLITVLSFLAALAISSVAYHLIELPAIRIGKHLSSYAKRKSTEKSLAQKRVLN